MDQETERQYETLLAQLRCRLESQAFLERHRRHEQDFTRQRALPFVVVIYTLINMLKRSLQDELDELFRLFRPAEVAQRQVSKSAFSQARQKLRYTAFVELNKVQVQHFYEHFAVQRWHGHRLLAIDGSLLDVPNTPENRAALPHPTPSPTGSYPSPTPPEAHAIVLAGRYASSGYCPLPQNRDFFTALRHSYSARLRKRPTDPPRQNRPLDFASYRSLRLRH